MAGVVEAALADGLPRLAVENLRVEFQFPNDFERLALGVVVKAGQADERACAWGWLDGLDEVSAGADADNLAGFKALLVGSGRRGVHGRCNQLSRRRITGGGHTTPRGFDIGEEAHRFKDNGSRLEHTIFLQPEVEVVCPNVMFLDERSRHRNFQNGFCRIKAVNGHGKQISSSVGDAKRFGQDGFQTRRPSWLRRSDEPGT